MYERADARRKNKKQNKKQEVHWMRFSRGSRGVQFEGLAVAVTFPSE